MAIKRKSGGGGGGANWMDTYGDMVTLLLCFFVLLYSMSTISEEKFRAIVQSFNPSALEQSTMTSGNEGPLADPEEGIGSKFGMTEPQPAEEESLEDQQQTIDEAIEQLYEMLKQIVEENGEGQAVEITKGDGYVFVSFNESVFFDGDSYVIRPEGQRILDLVAGALDQAAPYIDELRIMGHTAQARTDRPNNVYNDRFLASNRATNVTVYLQERCSLSPARIVSVGYGQHRPIDLNNTPEQRSHNRRVEMIITGLDLMNQLGDAIEQYTSIRSGEANLKTSETPASAPVETP